jgi:hypothetical protein
MFWWMVLATVLVASEGQFKIVNLTPHCNRTVSVDWNDPNSFAGLVAGERWIFGVPFFILDPALNNGRVAVRDFEIPINAPATFLFALIANPQPNALLVVRYEDGKEQQFSLADAVPAIVAHPPIYRWHIDMVAIKVERRTIKSVRIEGADLFALTLSTHSEADLSETFKTLNRRREQWRVEQAIVAQLQALRDNLASLKERVKALIAIGEFADRLVEMSRKVGVKVTKASSMDEAVRQAVEFASPGDIILLSPGCASQDMFRNYEHRGEEFREVVRRLSSKN